MNVSFRDKQRRYIFRFWGVKGSRGQDIIKISLEPLNPRNLEPFNNIGG